MSRPEALVRTVDAFVAATQDERVKTITLGSELNEVPPIALRAGQTLRGDAQESRVGFLRQGPMAAGCAEEQAPGEPLCLGKTTQSLVLGKERICFRAIVPAYLGMEVHPWLRGGARTLTSIFSGEVVSAYSFVSAPTHGLIICNQGVGGFECLSRHTLMRQ